MVRSASSIVDRPSSPAKPFDGTVRPTALGMFACFVVAGAMILVGTQRTRPR